MKRNIVILLCLVFFTQSAFADWKFWCDDCIRERDTCYNYNNNWQNLHKDESAQIKELTTQKNDCLQKKDSWICTAKGILVVSVGVLLYVFIKDRRHINNLNAQIVALNAQIAAHQPIHNVVVHNVANANINIQN
jgi:hypothetical protein